MRPSGSSSNIRFSILSGELNKVAFKFYAEAYFSFQRLEHFYYSVNYVIPFCDFL